MARYFHRTNKTSSAAPSTNEIGEGEITINSLSTLGGRLYIKLSNGEIRRFIGLGLTEAQKTRHGGTNNTFASESAPSDGSADSLMRFQYNALGNHTINNINSGKLTWNDGLGRLNINRAGTPAGATLHVGGDVKISTMTDWSGSTFNSNFKMVGWSNTDNSLYGIPSQNFVSYISDGGIPSSKLGTIGTDKLPIIPVNKGGTGIDVGAGGGTADGSIIHYYYRYNGSTGQYDTRFTTENNFKWDSDNDRLGVNTATPETTLHVNGTIRYDNRPSPTTITPIGVDYQGNIVEDSSSRRFKEDIQPYTKSLSTIINLAPVTFKFLGNDKVNAGLIAEDLDDLGLDEFVIKDEQNRPKSILYSNIVALLINGIKELKTELDQVKQQLGQ